MICKRSFHESIPPLKIQSLFDGDYFKYSVFFDSCNILCTDICQSTDSPEETLSSIYPESTSLNETILIYYNKDFLACGKQNAVYRATVDFLPDQLATIHITFLDTSTAETLYELSASCYQPISLSTTGGMQYE